MWALVWALNWSKLLTVKRNFFYLLSSTFESTLSSRWGDKPISPHQINLSRKTIFRWTFDSWSEQRNSFKYILNFYYQYVDKLVGDLLNFELPFANHCQTDVFFYCSSNFFFSSQFWEKYKIRKSNQRNTKMILFILPIWLKWPK